MRWLPSNLSFRWIAKIQGNNWCHKFGKEPMGCGGSKFLFWCYHLLFFHVDTMWSLCLEEGDCHQTHARFLLRAALSTWTLLHSLLHLLFLSIIAHFQGCSKRMYCFDFAFIHFHQSLLSQSCAVRHVVSPWSMPTLLASSHYLTQ